MNFGHGELGFGACPSAKSWPVAEYWTVFNASTPSAFEALAMTVFASCADADQTMSAASETAARTCFFMVPPAFRTRIVVRCGRRNKEVEPRPYDTCR